VSLEMDVGRKRNTGCYSMESYFKECGLVKVLRWVCLPTSSRKRKKKKNVNSVNQSKQREISPYFSTVLSFKFFFFF